MAVSRGRASVTNKLRPAFVTVFVDLKVHNNVSYDR